MIRIVVQKKSYIFQSAILIIMLLFVLFIIFGAIWTHNYKGIYKFAPFIIPVIICFFCTINKSLYVSDMYIEPDQISLLYKIRKRRQTTVIIKKEDIKNFRVIVDVNKNAQGHIKCYTEVYIDKKDGNTIKFYENPEGQYTRNRYHLIMDLLKYSNEIPNFSYCVTGTEPSAKKEIEYFYKTGQELTFTEKLKNKLSPKAAISVSNNLESEDSNTYICSKCNKEVSAENKKVYKSDDGIRGEYICNDCAKKIEQEYYLATQNVSLVKATISGIIASIIIGVLFYWSIIIASKYFNTKEVILVGSVLSGLLISIMCSFGANKKKGWKIQILSGIFTIITILYTIGLYVLNMESSASLFKTLFFSDAKTFIYYIKVLPFYPLKLLEYGIIINLLGGFFTAVCTAKREKLELKK
ncbi:hypothetical protein IJ182_10900 [bacterium]|nr:hypothetical protein [bacterium]